MNKFYIFFIYIAASSFLLSTNSTVFAQDKSLIKLYYNDTYNYELYYDSNLWSWYKKRGDRGIEFHKDSSKGIDHVVTVYIHIKENIGSRDELLEFSKKSPDSFIRGISKVFPDAKLISSKETFLANYPAYSIEYKYTIKNLSMEMKVHGFSVFTAYNNHLYQVTYETPEDYFKKHLNDFRTLILSLSFR